jgi:hypothetical protein
MQWPLKRGVRVGRLTGHCARTRRSVRDWARRLARGKGDDLRALPSQATGYWGGERPSSEGAWGRSGNVTELPGHFGGIAWEARSGKPPSIP